jgi:phosphatidylinositol glycan class B
VPVGDDPQTHVGTLKLPSDLQAVGGRLGFRHGLGLILLLGLTIRLLLLATPRAYFPDEIFQYLEPAHRLVFGQGIVTWEYRYGIRSWLVPLMLVGPMALGNWMAPASAAYLVLPKLLIVAISLLEILAAGEIGRKLSPSHGLFAAFVMANWSEAAFFGTQALTEAVAVAIFLPGAALLYDRKRHGPGMLALAGALIAFAAILRFEYAPAIGLFVLLRCGWDRRRWIWILPGAACVLALSALVDVSMGQTPFGWMLENLR